MTGPAIKRPEDYEYAYIPNGAVPITFSEFQMDVARWIRSNPQEPCEDIDLDALGDLLRDLTALAYIHGISLRTIAHRSIQRMRANGPKQV